MGISIQLNTFVLRYERQIKELKAELTMRDTLAGRGQVNYSDLTDSELHELKILVASFLDGNATVDQLPCQTLKQVKETYRQMQLAHQASVSSQVLPPCCASCDHFHLWSLVMINNNGNDVISPNCDHPSPNRVFRLFANCLSSGDGVLPSCLQTVFKLCL